MNKINYIFLKLWPFLVLITISLAFFYQFFLKGLIPMPTDFIVGVYHPWSDYFPNTPVKNGLLADVPSLIYPVKKLGIDILKSGQLPFWDPHQFGGHPLLANFQSALFYPLNIIFFFTDFVNAWVILIILQPILSSIFMYLFLRHLKLSKLPSIFGGISYAFSGFNLIWLEYGVFGHVASLIPLILLLLDLFLQKKKSLFGVLLSFCLGSQLLAGYPQFSVYTLWLIIAWTFFRSKKSIFKVLFFCLLGFGLVSFQLIPGIELLNNSQRVSEKISFNEQYLPYQQLITIFAPDFFGNPATHNFWGPGDYINTVGFSGVIVLFFALLAIFTKFRNKLILFLSILSLITLLLVLPTPLAFLHKLFLPGGSGARLSRMLIIFNFSLVILASFGIESFLVNQFSRLNKLLIIKFFIFAVFLIACLLIPKNNLSQNLTISIRNLILPLSLALTTSFFLYLRNKIPNLTKVIVIILISLSIFELFRFGLKYNPFSKKEYLYPKTPIFEFLQKNSPGYRIAGYDVLPISLWLPFNIDSFSGFDGIYPKETAKTIAVINSGNTDSTPMGKYGNIEKFDTKFFDLTNTKYILTIKKDKENKDDVNGEIADKFLNPKFKKVFDDKYTVILENTNNLPRAFFVSDWQTEKNEDILKTLLDKNFPINQKIILSKDFSDFQKSEKNKSSVEILKLSPNINEFKTTSDNNGFLFISNTYYPGWKAKVDGKEVEVLRADYNFQAVPVNSGTHLIKLTFDPQSFKLGLIISCVSLLISLIIFIKHMFKLV